MATNLAPVDAREVLRCDHCHLVQFRTANSCCRKCRKSLDEPEPEPVLTQAVSGPPPAVATPHLQIALAIRSLRQSNGLSQRQLALRMQVPRTYVSKIENDNATPTLSSLERLARALEVSVPDLLAGSTRNRDAEVRNLVSDDFISELMPYVCKLDALQRSSVLAQLRDIASSPRRGA
jgi:transcriptional regulator with XRE-family HTH domain